MRQLCHLLLFAVLANAAEPVPASLMRIAQTAQRNLLRLAEYGLFDDIRFSLKGDTLILTGQASRPILRQSAEAAVKSIEGVEKVENRIEVLPLSSFDEDIRFRAYQAIYGHPALSRYNPNRGTPVFISSAAAQTGLSHDPPPGYHPIHLIVHNQKLRLTGVVQNVGDKTIAGLIANGLGGVFEVINDLAIADEMTPIRRERKKQFARR